MTENVMLTGTFQEKPFPLLLAEIRQAGKTGILMAQKGEIVKRAFFQNGEPIASRSNIKKELLGEILCKRGKISRAQLDEVILESQKDSGDNFGQIITKKGILSQDELYSNTKYQFISILFSLFVWEEGTYTFEDKDATGLVPPGLPRFHVKFSKLLSEGIRQIRKDGFIDRILGKTDQVLKLTDLSYRSEELSFQGADREVLDVMVEGMTVQEVIDSVPLDPDMTRKILYALSNLGVVELQVPVEPEAKEKEKKEEEKAMEQEAAPVEELQEEIPALDQTSLASVMDDLMPESAEADEALPSFEEEVEPVAEAEPVFDEVEEELLPPQDEVEAEEATEEVSELIEAAVDEAAGEEVEEITGAEDAESEEVVHDEEAELIASMDEEAGIEEELPAAEEEEEEEAAGMSHEDEADLIASMAAEAGLEEEETSAEEVPEEEASGEEVPVEGAEEDQEAEEVKEEEGSTGEEEEPEEALTPDQEAVLEEAVEKEAEEEAVAPETEHIDEEEAPAAVEEEKKKRRWPVLVGVPVVVIALLYGGMTLFYANKAREVKSEKASKAADLSPAAKVESKTPEEIIKEMAKDETLAGTPVPATPDQPPVEEAEKVPVEPLPPENAVPEKKVVAAVPPEKAPPVAKPAPAAETPAPQETPPETKAPAPQVTKVIPATAITAKREPWEDAYDAGLSSFNNGNLESAFSKWSEVIQNAPDDAYSIQIELTSYLNYAARDIRESGPNEKIFIVETSLNEKMVYKVLCGIYPDKAAADGAFRNLTPYLKAQNPYMIRVSRLKDKLNDSTP